MNNEDIKGKKGSIKDKVRRGRGNGSGLGGEAGRGHKGQKARSGYSKKLGFEGGQTPLYRQLPKRKGFTNNNKITYLPINLELLNNISKENDVIDENKLRELGLIKGLNIKIKVLAQGDINTSITIVADGFSKRAIEKLEKAKCICKIKT